MIETMPTYFKEKEPPIISYTYTKTIANKIFNFSSTLSDLDYHQFHNNPSQCECNTSSHLYQPYGHVITGDLSIIPNFKLRDLNAKGPKYRDPCKVDWDKNLSLLCEVVDQYALQWVKREIVELSVLSSWKEMVKGQIEERNSKLKLNFKQPTGKVLQNADVKACLSDLHSKYVFVPAGKAPNNVIIICKRYYIETQLDSRKQVIAFQDRVITINIKEAQHPLKREKQVIDKSSIMLKISTKSMHRVLV